MKRSLLYFNDAYYRTLIAVISIAAVSAGVALYIFFRQGDYIFTGWIEELAGKKAGFLAKASHASLDFGPYAWIIYSLPGGLWAFSYALIIAGTWMDSRSPLRIAWLASVPLIVLGLEFLQFFEVIRGTFSMADVLADSVGLLSGFFSAGKIKSLGYENKNRNSNR